MRENWGAVGEALKVGRRMHKSDRAFGQWCEENFPGLDRRERADAMWMEENFGVWSPDTSAVTPGEIRRSYNEAQRIGPLPPDLEGIISDTSIELDTRSAEKVVKLVRRSEAGDEGSALAKRHVEALARKHEVTPEQLTKAAARKAPELP